jgi:hypothetical protein
LFSRDQKKQLYGVTTAIGQTGREAPRGKQRSWDEKVIFLLRVVIISSA